MAFSSYKQKRYRKRKAANNYTRSATKSKSMTTISKMVNQYSAKATLRKWDTLSMPSNTANPMPFVLTWTLAYFDPSSNFINMYDQYKVLGIKLTFFRSQDISCLTQTDPSPFPSSASSAVAQCILHLANDWDDATAPAHLDNLVNRPSYRPIPMFQNGNPPSWFIKPACSAPINGAGASSMPVAQVLNSPWINTSGGSGVYFYGVKGFMELIGVTNEESSYQQEVQIRYLAELYVVGKGLTKIA